MKPAYNATGICVKSETEGVLGNFMAAGIQCIPKNRLPECTVSLPGSIQHGHLQLCIWVLNSSSVKTT